MMRGIFIKHKAYRDVCCLVLKHFHAPGRHKLKIEWWNLACINSYNMGYQQNIEITDSELKDWLWTNDWLFTNNKVPCLRDANWSSF